MKNERITLSTSLKELKLTNVELGKFSRDVMVLFCIVFTNEKYLNTFIRLEDKNKELIPKLLVDSFVELQNKNKLKQRINDGVLQEIARNIAKKYNINQEKDIEDIQTIVELMFEFSKPFAKYHYLRECPIKWHYCISQRGPYVESITFELELVRPIEEFLDNIGHVVKEFCEQNPERCIEKCIAICKIIIKGCKRCYKKISEWRKKKHQHNTKD